MIQPHSAPCLELRQVQQDVAAHEQALLNSKEWQERLENRINGLYGIALGSLISALIAAAGVVVSLLSK